MPNILTLTVPNPDEILNAGAFGANADLRVQSSTTQTGAFADLSGTGSTPIIPIVTDTVSYTAYDPNGLTTDWYRTRFESVGAIRLSDWSEPFQAGAGPATAVGQYAQTAGVKLRLGRAVTDTDDDELIQKYCDQVNQQIETRIGHPICPIPSATYLFDGCNAVDRGRSILVPMGVRSVTLFEVAQTTNGAFSTVAATDYFLRPNVADRPHGWPAWKITLADIALGGTPTRFYDGIANIRIAMAAGFAAIPDDLVDCGETTTVRAFQSRRTGQGDVVGSDDLGRSIISRILANEWKEVLDVYRIDRGVR